MKQLESIASNTPQSYQNNHLNSTALILLNLPISKVPIGNRFLAPYAIQACLGIVSTAKIEHTKSRTPAVQYEWDHHLLFGSLFYCQIKSLVALGLIVRAKFLKLLKASFIFDRVAVSTENSPNFFHFPLE